MSHVATVSIRIKAPQTLCKVLQNQGIEVKQGNHKVKLFNTDVNAEMSFQLKGWQHRCAVTGEEIKYDNYNGNWGKQEHMDKVLQDYAVEVAKEQTASEGYSLESQQVLADGSVELVVNSY